MFVFPSTISLSIIPQHKAPFYFCVDAFVISIVVTVVVYLAA